MDAVAGSTASQAGLDQAQTRLDQSFQFQTQIQQMTNDHSQRMTTEKMLFETEQSDVKRQDSVINAITTLTDQQSSGLER